MTLSFRVMIAALLMSLLASCTVNIDPIDKGDTTASPVISSVYMNSRSYNQDPEQVATNATDRFTIEARAQDYTTLTIRVVKELNNGASQSFATRSCGVSDGTCSLTFPSNRDWNDSDVGVYSVVVEAVNANTNTSRRYDDWLIVQLPTAQ